MMYNKSAWHNLRLIGMILVLALTSLGTGCRTRTPPDEPGEVTITFACREWALGEYEALAEQFQEENLHIKIRLISFQEILGSGEALLNWTEDNLRRLVSTADTLTMQPFVLITRLGLLQDLTPFIEADQGFHSEDFYPAALESLQWDGGTWGLPLGVSLDMIFYDKEAFDEAGVTYPEPGWTWDDFLAKAQALTKREGDQVTRWGFAQRSFNPTPFIAGRAAPLVDDTITPLTPLLDTPKVAQAVRWYADLYLKHQVAPFFEPGQPEAYRLVEEGHAAMWSETVYNLQRCSGGREIGIAPYPVDKPADATTPISVEGYVMSAGTAHPQESWRWLDFLTHHATPGTFGPPALPARRSVAAETGYWETLSEEEAAAYRFALEHAYSDMLAYDFAAAFALPGALKCVLKGEKDVEEALAEAQIEAYELLSKLAGASEPRPIAVATQEPTPEEGMTITFFSSFDQSDYKTLAQAFHESHPNITVKVKGPSSDRLGLEEMAADSDCFLVWGRQVAEEKTRRHILNLQPFLDAEPAFPLADFYPPALEAFRWQSDLWGLPVDVSVKLVYYNKDLFDTAGVAYPQPGWDLDDFLSKAQALTWGNGEDKQSGFIYSNNTVADLYDFIHLWGTSVVDEQQDPPWPRFDDPAVIEAMRWYVALSTVHGVTPLLPEKEAGERRWTLLSEGKVAMWTDINSAWQSPLPLDWLGVAPLPLNEGGSIVISSLDLQGYYISAETPYPDQCWTWLRFLSDHGQQVARNLPARRSAAESSGYVERTGEEMAAAMRFSLEHGLYDSVSVEGSWFVRAYNWLEQALEQAMQGQDVAQILAETQRKAKVYVLCLESKGGFADEEAQKTCAEEADSR